VDVGAYIARLGALGSLSRVVEVIYFIELLADGLAAWRVPAAVFEMGGMLYGKEVGLSLW
jgi:hypothetical protein